MTSLRSAALISTALALPPGGAAERTPLPEKLLIAKWGTANALDGSAVTVGTTTLSALLENQRKIGRTEIALDFEHGTVDGQQKGPEPRPVAGYGTLSVEAGVGIWYHPTTWTPEGASYYTGRHYRDISPTVIRDDSGEIIALHSVALTRAGQLEGLHAFSSPALRASLTALSADASPPPPSPDNKSAKMKELLCKLLGLPDTATDEEITAAATEKIAAMSSAGETEDLKDLAACDKEPSPMSANIAAMTARLDALDRARILDAAKAAGKIIPLSADALAALPIATLSALVDGLEAGKVPMASATPGQHTHAPQPKALSTGEETMCKLLGIDPEKFRTLAPTV